MKKPTKALYDVAQPAIEHLSVEAKMNQLIEAAQEVANDRVLRLPQLGEKNGHADSTNWKSVKEGTLPPPIRLGGRSVGWLESEIDAVIALRKFASRTRQVVDMRTFVSLLVAANSSTRSKEQDHA